MSSGWDALAEAIATARAEVAQAAPDAQTAAEGEAYVARILASSLTGAVLGHLLVEDGLARALPTYGGPNPHYRMRHAGVDSAGHYHLAGQLNASERVGVGLYRFDATGTAFEVGYAAFDEDNTGPDGKFALDLSADASGPGTLPIPPDARALLIRTLHRAAGEPAAQLSLSGATQAPGLALATGSIDGALAQAGKALVGSVRQFLEWTRVTSARPNQLDAPPPHLAEAVQGDPDTAYFLGYYELADGEWLEVTMPPDLPGYWSLHAYNHWNEDLQTEGAHDRNTQPDADGHVRVRIGPDIPSGVPNRIDTLGRRRGILICRIIDAPGSAAPEARLGQTSEET